MSHELLTWMCGEYSKVEALNAETGTSHLLCAYACLCLCACVHVCMYACIPSPCLILLLKGPNEVEKRVGNPQVKGEGTRACGHMLFKFSA